VDAGGGHDEGYVEVIVVGSARFCVDCGLLVGGGGVPLASSWEARFSRFSRHC